MLILKIKFKFEHQYNAASNVRSFDVRNSRQSDLNGALHLKGQKKIVRLNEKSDLHGVRLKRSISA